MLFRVNTLCGKGVGGWGRDKEIRDREWLRGYCSSAGERHLIQSNDGQGVPGTTGSGHIQVEKWLGRNRAGRGLRVNQATLRDG